MLKNLNKLSIFSYALVSTLFLASCTGSTSSQLRITDNCDVGNTICAFELADVVVNSYTNLLGKTTERISRTTPVGEIVGSFTWIAYGGNIADNSALQSATGISCGGDTCSYSSNPTGFTFNDGNHGVSISGRVIVNGRSVDLSTIPSVTIDTKAVLPMSVTYRTPSGSSLSATEIATIFASYNGDKYNVATVTGDNTTSPQTLTFTCEAGYHVTEDQVTLAENGFITANSSSEYTGAVIYTGSKWEASTYFAATNSGYGNTGVGCIAD